MSSSSLVVISGPSGSGKSTLISMLLNAFDGFVYSVSATTRAPREKEKNGEDYFFVSQERFEEMIRQNEFLEWEHVFGAPHYYGTPQSFVEDQLKMNDVLIDVDVRGAMQIIETVPDALMIFIDVPDSDELRQRILNRESMEENELKSRIMTAEKERKFKSRYKHVVINRELGQAFAELKAIIESEVIGRRAS